MKKIALLIALVSIGFFSIAQTKKIKEGVAEFDITYPSMTPEMKEVESMLPKVMTIYFKNEQSRVEMNSGMGSTIVLGDNTKKDITVLMDMMGKKIAIRQTQEEIAKKEAELKKKGKMPEFSIVETKETKVIAGYKCKKGIIQYTMDGKKEQMVCYYTDELPRVNSGTENMALNEVKGFLMEYNINQGGVQMRIVAKSAKAQTVDSNLFSVPSDYKLMTKEEISEMMGGKE
jgi:GLPGLI family protein